MHDSTSTRCNYLVEIQTQSNSNRRKKFAQERGPTELRSFPAKKQRDGTDRDIAFPANAETRNMIQRAILAEYEKIVAGSDPVPSANAPKP
jgi:hypothetical protein